MSTVNCWQYSRNVYLFGRNLKNLVLTNSQKTAVVEFIKNIAAARPGYFVYINGCAGNPPVMTISGTTVSLDLSKQNAYALGKMVQRIGRSLKVQFCSETEKGYCDALFAAFEPSSSSSSEPSSSSSSETSSSSSEE